MRKIEKQLQLALLEGCAVMKNRVLLARPDLALSAEWFADACKASRQHNELAAWALKVYGDHGPQVSGYLRDHFPQEAKAKLRALADHVSFCSDGAYDMRPKRVRMSTIRALGSAVAARDGSGFYGPQP